MTGPGSNCSGRAAAHRAVAGAGGRAASGHPSGLLTPALLEQVRERVRIADLFNPAELRKAGREFVTRCPWHDDRRPSLTVSPQRNRVHCFVCGKGTDAIGWLQERQGLSFQEAVHELARQSGVGIDAADPEAQRRFEQEWQERRRLQARRTEQRRQFHRALQQQLEQGGEAARYLQARGLSAETARTWQLGVAGDRLVIPLNDPAGQAVGFCGRAMGDQQPKYRNSAGDLLFQRNGLVFGLDQAATTIRREGTALLVEGPLDVIQLHQAGFTQAVACLGTSVSALQLQLLQRHGMKHLLVALDGDGAGRAAAERLLLQLQPELMRGQLSASVVPLPEGQDPDGLLRQQGAGALEGLLASAQHWLEWRLDRLLAPLASTGGGSSLEVLQVVERDGRALVQSLPEGVLRQRAEQRLAQALDAMPGAGSNPPPQMAVLNTGMEVSTARQRAERRVLRLFIHAPQCRELLSCLSLQEPGCRVALEWLGNLAVVSADSFIAPMALQLAAQLPGAVGVLLAQAAAPAPEVITVLQRDPQAELQALLDVLEPIAQQAPAVGLRPAQPLKS